MVECSGFLEFLGLGLMVSGVWGDMGRLWEDFGRFSFEFKAGCADSLLPGACC